MLQLVDQGEMKKNLARKRESLVYEMKDIGGIHVISAQKCGAHITLG
jgi:hypothetical protein